MIAPAVVGVARKLTELVVRAISPNPSVPHRPTVGVIDGVSVVVVVRDGVRVRVGVPVRSGVRVIEGVAETVGERVPVGVGATPTLDR
jgi:hypothetical protein